MMEAILAVVGLTILVVCCVIGIGRALVDAAKRVRRRR